MEKKKHLTDERRRGKAGTKSEEGRREGPKKKPNPRGLKPKPELFKKKGALLLH